MTILDFDMKAQLIGQTLTIDMTQRIDSVVTETVRRQISFENKAVEEALVKLGWTPPAASQHEYLTTAGFIGIGIVHAYRKGAFAGTDHTQDQVVSEGVVYAPYIEQLWRAGRDIAPCDAVWQYEVPERFGSWFGEHYSLLVNDERPDAAACRNQCIELALAAFAAPGEVRTQLRDALHAVPFAPVPDCAVPA